MVLLVDMEYSGSMTPTYVLTCVDNDDLEEYWKDDSRKYVWQKKFKTSRGLARAIRRYFRLQK